MMRAVEDSTTARPSAALRVLLQGIVDYAGLFPPASLSMSAAVSEYAAQRDSEHAWMLGRFVLPAARLLEFENEAASVLPREGARFWALSALLSGDVEDDLRRVEQFNAAHRDARHGAVLVDTVELKTYTAHDIAHAAEVLDGAFDTYMEIPVAEDPEELVSVIADAHAKAKIRTGGLTPEVFPTATQVARFIRRCVERGVPFKATAGLHHPWRDEYPLTYAFDAPRCGMFGFVNVLLAVAAVLAGASEREVIEILEERDAGAFVFDVNGARWRRRALSADVLRRARESMTAFGSCSFREPVAELQASGLL